jgi:deoxyribose-phosphate aldolase
VGFPLGDVVSTQLKIAEAKEALRNGAGEIDVVLCWRALQAGSLDVVEADLSAVTAVAHQGQALIKAILEVCELNEQQIRDACAICAHVGADFVKTSTGFGRGGANEAALRIMRDAFRGGIKIAGGVKADNLGALLAAALGEEVEALDPLKIRIGESSLLLPNRPT